MLYWRQNPKSRKQHSKSADPLFDIFSSELLRTTKCAATFTHHLKSQYYRLPRTSRSSNSIIIVVISLIIYTVQQTKPCKYWQLNVFPILQQQATQNHKILIYVAATLHFSFFPGANFFSGFLSKTSARWRRGMNPWILWEMDTETPPGWMARTVHCKRTQTDATHSIDTRD